MAMAIGVHVPSHGAQMPNARSSTTPVTGRDGRAITRSPAAPSATTANTISRAAAVRRPAATIQRTWPVTPMATNSTTSTARSATAQRRTVNTAARPESTSARSATNAVVRSAAPATSGGVAPRRPVPPPVPPHPVRQPRAQPLCLTMCRKLAADMPHAAILTVRAWTNSVPRRTKHIAVAFAVPNSPNFVIRKMPWTKRKRC